LLAGIFSTETSQEAALREARGAADLVLAENRPVDLEPRPAPVRRLQHHIAQELGLASESRGREPYRRVVYYPPLAPERPV
jgi:predicted RNA-binding protein Jag